MNKQQAWYQGWPVIVNKIGGPGSGWFAPPKGTHGSKGKSPKKDYAKEYAKIKNDSTAIDKLSREFMRQKGLTDEEIDSVFVDGDKWVKTFSMGQHPFQDDIKKGTERAKAIHAWNQMVLQTEGKGELSLYRGVGKQQVQQMIDNKEGQYTWIGIRRASSWSESNKTASKHAGQGGAVVNGKFPVKSSFMSYYAFPNIFGREYENEHIMVAGKQEGGLRWLRLKGRKVVEE